MFRRKHHNRKWHDRPQLYRGRFYFLRKLAQLVLILGVVVFLFAATVYFRTSETLGIKHVSVIGKLKHMTIDDVILLSGIKRSDKLFAIDLGAVRAGILRHPWVDDVTIRREFPDTIQISVTEATPVALLMIDGFFLVDAHGRVFKKWEAGDERNLPVISGLNKDFVTTYPAMAAKQLTKVLDFLKFVNEQEFYKMDPVSEVSLDAVYGFTVVTSERPLTIFYGNDDVETKQKKLEKFKLSEFFENKRITRLDLAVNDKVVVRENK